MKIKALSHVAIQVTDLNRALAFYTGVLGLPEQFRLTNDRSEPWLAYVRVAGNQFIELFGSATSPNAPTKSAGPVHLCLEVDDIHDAFNHITSKGIQPLHGPPKLEADHAWQFWIADPDGNPIEFHQFTEQSLQKAPIVRTSIAK